MEKRKTLFSSNTKFQNLHLRNPNDPNYRHFKYFKYFKHFKLSLKNERHPFFNFHRLLYFKISILEIQMIQIIVISNISNSQLSLKKRTISISLRIIKPTIIPNLRNISNKSSPIHITTSQKSCKSPKSKILAILLSSLNRFPPTTPFPSSHKQDRDTFPLATWARYRELWDTRWLRGGVVQG